MPKHSARLDDVFKALSDPTRRAVLEQLSRGPATTSQLAESFGMALPSFAQHLHALEACGLVESEKAGRVRTYALAPKSLQAASRWLGAQSAAHDQRGDRPDAVPLAGKKKA